MVEWSRRVFDRPRLFRSADDGTECQAGMQDCSRFLMALRVLGCLCARSFNGSLGAPSADGSGWLDASLVEDVMESEAWEP